MRDIEIERVGGASWWRAVRRWIGEHHRHHDPPTGWRYGLVARRGPIVVGVAVVGRPLARALAGAEVTRLCTWGPSRRRFGAASALLREVARIEPVVVTYTLAHEAGGSLEAAGWIRDGGPRRARRWTCPSRPRRARADELVDKQRWRPCTHLFELCNDCRPAYGSLFSGIGGLDLAVEAVFGARARWLCENDEYCRGVLRRHWPRVPLHGDIRELEAPEHVDIIAGGFPCQDVSNAGKRAGIHGPRSGLFAELIRVVGLVRPRVVIMENVPGVLGGLGAVLGPLAALGYDASWGVLGACCVGAPHRRERVFIVAADPDREPLRLQPQSLAGKHGAALARDHGLPRALADAAGRRQLQPQGPLEEERRRPGDRGRAGDAADPPRVGCDGGLQQQREGGGPWTEALRAHPGWSPEPDLGRVAYGVPARMDRLRVLGNGVVTEQAEEAIRRIYPHLIRA